MKKLLIIITLFISSFFLFCIEDAKASSYNIELDFSLLNENSLSFKNEVETFLSSNSEYSSNYIIFYDLYSEKLSAILFKDFDSYTFSYLDYSNRVDINSNISFYIYNINSSISSSSSIVLYKVAYGNKLLTNFLYTNFDFAINPNLIINYTYEDFTYVDSKSTTNKISSLEEIYIEYQKFTGTYVPPEPDPEPEENPHKEELDKLTNFYTMIIDKISYLAEQIANNYILLSIIGIFILTFVFLLIFRRFL